jgi:hypothetical protein
MFELNDETRWILGLPNFRCSPIAWRLNQLGIVPRIAKRAEDEQAGAIHWMLSMYETHGEDWREHARTVLQIPEGESVDAKL